MRLEMSRVDGCLGIVPVDDQWSGLHRGEWLEAEGSFIKGLAKFSGMLTEESIFHEGGVLASTH
jgi:hypothetical protein